LPFVFLFLSPCGQHRVPHLRFLKVGPHVVITTERQRTRAGARAPCERRVSRQDAIMEACKTRSGIATRILAWGCASGVRTREEWQASKTMHTTCASFP